MSAPKLKILPISKLVPNRLNPNEMNETMFEKLKMNIGRTNRYPPLIVRPLTDGRYEIIDGYYRYLVLKELGVQEVRCDVWNVNEREAKLLLATLNRLHGTDDVRKRAILISELAKDFGNDSFTYLLPETNRAIEAMLKVMESEELNIEAEQGLIEEQLMQSGIDLDKAEQIVNLLKPPETKPVIKFVFDNEKEYNKAVKFFGRKGDVKKLLMLIENYVEGRKKI